MAFIDRVKFDADSDELLVWKFPSEDLRIGTQLVVNESQEALLVRGGKALDLFGPGRHTLSTNNIPLLRKLVNLPFGGKTPFTAEVWFINRTAKRDLSWGTQTPIQLIDPKFNYPVSVRAYGRWGIRVCDSRSFVTQIVGTLSSADFSKVQEYFTGEIVQRLSDALAKYFVERQVSIFQANARLNELSEFTQRAITPEFDRFGIEIVNFNVERISIPDEEQAKFQEILGKRMEIEQISEAKVGDAYRAMRSFDVMEKAAENESGIAGAALAGGLGIGAGIGVGSQAGRELGDAMKSGGGDGGSGDIAAKLKQLKALLQQDLITQEEFDAKKRGLLDAL